MTPPTTRKRTHERCGFLLACPCWTDGATAGQKVAGTLSDPQRFQQLAAERASGGLDVERLGRYWYEDWSRESFDRLPEGAQRLWTERGLRVAARLSPESDNGE